MAVAASMPFDHVFFVTYSLSEIPFYRLHWDVYSRSHVSSHFGQHGNVAKGIDLSI